MNAHLVLDAAAEHIIAGAERTIGIHQEFRHQKQRYPLGSGRRIGQARKNQMDDIVRKVMLAIGDENLLTENAVRAVIGPLGPRAQCSHIGTGLRFGEIHGSHPRAGDELWQIGVFQIIRRVGFKRLDGAKRQCRPDAKSHGAGIPHFQCRHREHHRQTLSAELFLAGQGVPAGTDPVAVNIFPAGRHGDFGIFQRCSVLVTNLQERRNARGREFTGLFQDGIDQIVGKVGKTPGGDGLVQTCNFLQRVCDFLDGRPVH